MEEYKNILRLLFSNPNDMNSAYDKIKKLRIQKRAIQDLKSISRNALRFGRKESRDWEFPYFKYWKARYILAFLYSKTGEKSTHDSLGLCFPYSRVEHLKAHFELEEVNYKNIEYK